MRFVRRIFIDVGGLTCPKKGAREVMAAFKRWIQKTGLEGQVEVVERGCFGLCNLAPNLYIEPEVPQEGTSLDKNVGEGVWYSRFTTRDVPIIVRKHLREGKLVTRLIHYPDRRLFRKRKGGCTVAETLLAREIEVGDIAPDFMLKNQDGQEVTLSSFRGKKGVVLAFYPFDWSSICTAENCALTSDLAKFEGKETVIFGVSCDSHHSHKAWREKLGLKHELLSDLKREVSKKYGLYLEELNCSKRATVVIDKSGKVTFKKVQEIKVARSNQEILSAIRC